MKGSKEKMRVSKEIEIAEKKYVVRELTLREIINYFQALTNEAEKGKEKDETTTDTLAYFKGEIQTLLTLALEGDHKVEDFLDYTPSAIESLYEGFKDVNKVFFDTAAKVGIDNILTEVSSMIRTEFSNLLVSSSNAAIKKSLTMDSPTS